MIECVDQLWDNTAGCSVSDEQCDARRQTDIRVRVVQRVCECVYCLGCEFNEYEVVGGSSANRRVGVREIVEKPIGEIFVARGTMRWIG